MTAAAFGRYTIIRPLGGGGMANVYLAHDPVLGRDVAIKAPHVDRLDADGLARFMIEAQAVARLEHPAITPLYEYGEQAGRPFLIMRYLPGGSLADQITRRPLSLNEAIPIIDRVAAALDYAHARAVIHRDVKPANILFDDAGAAYLTDFGIARMMGAGQPGARRLTQTGFVAGTAEYMSPEQALGKTELDGRSDVYSLGIVLFEMLTGDIPYKAESTIQQAMQHISAPIPSILQRRPDLPPAMEAVIRRVLAKPPAERYPTAAALAADLRRVAAGQVPSRPSPAPSKAPAVPVWIWAVALLLVGLALVAAMSMGGSNGNGDTAGVTVAVQSPSPPSNETAAPSPAGETNLVSVASEPTSTTAPIAIPTDTPSLPPTPSRTPRLVPSPTATSKAIFCPGAFPARLAVGDRARVVNYQLNVRAGPGTNYDIIRRLDVGRTMDILDGPVCDDGQLWYYIISEEIVPRDGSKPYRAEGWLIEESDDEYYLEPIP